MTESLSKKPREFWINKKSLLNGGLYYKSSSDYTDTVQIQTALFAENYQQNTDSIHVIEYSAYSQLLTEVESLKAKLDKAKAGLEHYKYHFSGDGFFNDNVAKDTLKEIE